MCICSCDDVKHCHYFILYFVRFMYTYFVLCLLIMCVWIVFFWIFSAVFNIICGFGLFIVQVNTNHHSTDPKICVYQKLKLILFCFVCECALWKIWDYESVPIYRLPIVYSNKTVKFYSIHVCTMEQFKCD